MSIRFSRVSAMSNTVSAVFLVGGIPASQRDLNNWTSFQSFTQGMEKDEVISVHVDTFIYGEDEVYDASPEEIAYFYRRIEMRPDFVESRTKQVGESDFVMWLDK